MCNYIIVKLSKNIDDINMINIINNCYCTATNCFIKYNKQ